MSEFDVDEWLSDAPAGGGRGERKTYLAKWKDDGPIEVVLHPSSKIVSIWAHNWWREWTKRGEESKVVSWRFVSHESDAVLRKRFFRDHDGALETPPEHCPFGKLLEWVHQQIAEGAIDWTEEIFEVPGADRGRSLILHAGGFTGAFGSRNVTDEQKVELKRSKINLREAWRENCSARMQYVFRVVEYGRPELGIQVAMEAQSLGDKLKGAIKSRRDNLGVDLGNPFKHPCVFEWSYDEQKSNFGERYDARVVADLKITREIQAVLDQDSPDIESIVAPGDAEKLRLSFESTWIHKVKPPWDELFADALASTAREQSRTEATPPRAKEPDTSFDPAELSKPAESEGIACDVCDGEMKETDLICPHCGTEYDKSGKIVKRGRVPRNRGAA